MDADPIAVRLAVLERAFADYTNHHAAYAESKAEDIDRRLEEMNRFRAQINEERGLFVLRESYEERHETLVRRIVELELAASNLAGRMYMIGAVISVVVSLVVVAVNLIIKVWK